MPEALTLPEVRGIESARVARCRCPQGSRTSRARVLPCQRAGASCSSLSSGYFSDSRRCSRSTLKAPAPPASRSSSLCFAYLGHPRCAETWCSSVLHRSRSKSVSLTSREVSAVSLERRVSPAQAVATV